MADRWFYAHDGKRIGPFSGRQLHDLASAGEILITDTIWKEGVDRGVVAARVKYLFGITSSEAAPVSAASLATETTPAGPADPIQPLSPESAAVHSGPVEGTAVAEAPAGDAQAIPDTVELQPEAQLAPPAAPPPAPPKKPVKKGRAIAVKGAIIVSQDGTSAKYKHKCPVCSSEGSSWNSMRITAGVVRAVFFCTKCSKKRDVEIQCSMR